MKIEELVLDLASDFKGSYKDFIAYVYKVFTKKIDFVSKKDIKDKYIKIRKSILHYIIANEATITAELRKKKFK